MEEYLNQVNQRRKYFQEIATEESAVRKVRTQEVGSVRVSIIHSLSGLLLFFLEVVEKAIHTRAKKIASRSEAILYTKVKVNEVMALCHMLFLGSSNCCISFLITSSLSLECHIGGLKQLREIFMG